QYAVCRCSATEPPFSGKWYRHKAAGTYVCVACGARLFASEAKYDSGSGWPSFFQPLSRQAIALRQDDTHGMRRTEVRCAACESHLGHVFPDGPK
ncbi:peptide-methionine (R)-S-oxide reductase MsrB, partial [Salmonella enterica]